MVVKMKQVDGFKALRTVIPGLDKRLMPVISGNWEA
jgi:hypothetical protein